MDSKSKENAVTTFVLELFVAYLDDPNCNNPAENEGEWVLNENVSFDYSLCLENVFKSIDISFLHVPLPISEMACMHKEDSEESVFIVPPSKRDQSPIVFDRGQTQATILRESDDDLEPPYSYNSFITRISTPHDEKMRYNLNRGDGLNFGKRWRIPLQPFVPEGKPSSYYDRTRRGLGYVTPSPRPKLESDESLPSQSSDHLVGTLILVWG